MPFLFARFAFGCLAALATLASPLRSEVPDWFTHECKDVSGTISGRYDYVVLLRTAEISHSQNGRISITVREVIQILNQAGMDDIVAGYRYTAGIGHVSMKAWSLSTKGKASSVSTSQFLDVIADVNNFVWDNDRVLQVVCPKETDLRGFLACEFTEDRDPEPIGEEFHFDEVVPVLHCVLRVKPTPGAVLDSLPSSRLVTEPTVDQTTGERTWDLRDLPAQARRVPEGFLDKAVAVRVREYSPAIQYSFNTWEGFSGMTYSVSEPSYAPDAAVVEAAEKLAKRTDPKWTTIAALVTFVQTDVNYLSTPSGGDWLAGCRPHLPREVLKSHLGDCKDKAALLVALMKVSGIEGYEVLVSAERPDAVSPSYAFSGFNHAIVAIPYDSTVPDSWPRVDAGKLGKFVLFDPTEVFVPLGVLPAEDQGGYCLLVAPKGADLLKVPDESPAQSKWALQIQANLSNDGGLTLKNNLVVLGSSAARVHARRIYDGQAGFTRYLEEQSHRISPLAGHLKWDDAWSPENGRYTLESTLEIANYSHASDDGLTEVSPNVCEPAPSLPRWPKDFEGSYWMPAGVQETEIHLKLPAASKITSVPADWKSSGAQFEAVLTYQINGEEIVYRTNVRRQGALMDKTAYEALRKFYVALAQAERRPVVFKAEATAAVASAAH